MIHALLAALVALCIGSLSINPPQPAAASAEVPIGELASLAVVEATPEDVGTLGMGALANRRVVLRNVRPVPVQLEITRKSSVCLEAALSLTDLPPGQETSLTIATGVLPGAGPVRQFVEIRVSWTEDGTTHAERAIVELVYQPDSDILVRPEEASIVLPQGTKARFHIWVRPMDVEQGPPPPIASAECSLPGWSAEPVAPGEGDNPNVLKFRVSGRGDALGDQWGEVHFRYSDGRTAARVRVMARVLPPFRAFPGGASFVAKSGWSGPYTRELRLIPRPGVAQSPARLTFVQPSPWVSATLLDDSRVRIEFTPGEGTPPVGHARVRVEAADGALLLELPVAWWHPSAAIP